ncbi:MAG TPA: CRTAC1 family protein, partial [Saprospiraceae bacterium]|nr:CRTAC1 family protein [Saprospiraceae bacterium]
MNRHFQYFLFLVLFLASLSCKPSSKETVLPEAAMSTSGIQLKSLPASETGINFENKISDEGRINIFTWHFIYNGAGVATGDINNDGLPDIYFTGNQVPDRLYLNKGQFKFEDITAKAGISNHIWSSGVTMADVNGDGLLDIYVCKNSPTGVPDNNRNKLYINQGNLTFKEEAQQYGIDDIGFGTQATFFDADQDGDLDLYLVNQPFDEFSRLVNRPEVVATYPKTDRFFFFENGKFIDRSEAMGITDERYGLNATLGDFDMNGWTDIYICNDYHHGDRLFMNTNGKFRDEIQTRTGHTSFYSMGSDVGDINNDGWPDLFTLDMAYEEHYRSKTNMGRMDVDWFWSLVASGNHYQYMQNALQINQGAGYFSDMAQVAGISKSDWSFATLFADLDLDGDQDILITNGVLRDMRNNDFNKMVKDKYNMIVGPSNYLEVLKQLPSTPIANIMYSNDGKLHFTKLPPESGFSEKNFSHGMAYADFNGDGLLDVVINNENSVASVYENITQTSGHYLSISLEGPGKNVNGLGCSVIVYAGGTKQINTMQTTRGYFSAVEPVLHFGLGAARSADSLKVYWDHAEMSVLKNIPGNQSLKIKYSKEKKIPFRADPLPGVLAQEVKACDYVHHETPFDDYKKEVLLPYKLSQNGPFVSVADINGDKLEDFFIGGAAGYAGAVYAQNPDQTFSKTNQPAIEADKSAEDMGSVWLDSDGDHDPDLLVVSGSNEFEDDHPLLRP